VVGHIAAIRSRISLISADWLVAMEPASCFAAALAPLSCSSFAISIAPSWWRIIISPDLRVLSFLDAARQVFHLRIGGLLGGRFRHLECLLVMRDHAGRECDIGLVVARGSRPAGAGVAASGEQQSTSHREGDRSKAAVGGTKHA
jgi:hypothetical protein